MAMVTRRTNTGMPVRAVRSRLAATPGSAVAAIADRWRAAPASATPSSSTKKTTPNFTTVAWDSDHTACSVLSRVDILAWEHDGRRHNKANNPQQGCSQGRRIALERPRTHQGNGRSHNGVEHPTGEPLGDLRQNHRDDALHH